MPKIDPLVALFIGIVGVLAAFAAPMVMLLLAQGERLAGIAARMDALETGQAEIRGEIADVRDGLAATNEHLARIEAGLEAVEAVQVEHGARLGRIEDGQIAVRGDLSATNERMARVEGTVAGVLARAFPERMAQAPEAETGAGGR